MRQLTWCSIKVTVLAIALSVSCVTRPATATEPTTADRVRECSTKDHVESSFDFSSANYPRPLNWLADVSIGPSVTAQLVRYNFKSEKTEINSQGLGVGMSLRFYPQWWWDDRVREAVCGKNGERPCSIASIADDCRATTFDSKTIDQDAKTGKAAFALLSLAPTLFVTKDEKDSDLSIQPAILLSFFRDFLSVGVGIRANKPHQGNAFLLFGIGTGFKF